MRGFDIIGDVHGHADELRSLLARMDYAEHRGAWRHPERTAVFVGDLIDRGPAQFDTLRLVRAMVAAGAAHVVLGNHEFNAVAYATFDAQRSDFCRPHDDKNQGQHAEFLADIEFGSPLHRSIIAWFMTIPMWLDLGGLRVVHACWSPRHIAHLAAQAGPGNTLTQRLVIDGTTKNTVTHEAIETVLKGPEVHLDGVKFHDNDGNPREHARLRWWDTNATTLRAAALIPPGTQLLDHRDDRTIDDVLDQSVDTNSLQFYTEPHPVLFGHYWWRKESPETFNPLATCVDFSVAKGGVLTAYRWDDESELDATKFVNA